MFTLLIMLIHVVCRGVVRCRCLSGNPLYPTRVTDIQLAVPPISPSRYQWFLFSSDGSHDANVSHPD